MARLRVATLSIACALVTGATMGAGSGGQPPAGSSPSSADWDVRQARGTTRDIAFTTDEGTWMTVSVSPDAQTIVFDLLGEIYALPASGGDARLLTAESGVAVNFQPAVSPDGSRIAFISDREGQNNLWVMNADGSNPRIIEQNLRVRHSVPAWTPDGRFLVARRMPLSDEGRPMPEIWLYSVDGGKGVAVTRGTEHPRATEPAVSADGRYVFFTVEVADVEDPAKGGTQLRRLDRWTGDVLKITEGSERGAGGDARLSSGGGFSPRPSPDGRWLAFGRRLASGTISFKGHQLGPRTALWLRDLQTGAERLLVDPVDRDLQEQSNDWAGFLPGYAWSRDGSTLFLGQGGRLRRVDVASGKIDTIPFTAPVRRSISEQAYATLRLRPEEPLDVRFLRWPAVSPDFRQLAFQALGRVWLMDLPSGTPRRLLPDSFAPHQYAAAWSPDGQHIAFTSWTDEDRGHLWRVSARGGEPTRLTTTAGEYLNPVWTPDGSGLVVARSSGATLRGQMLAENAWYELWHVPAASGSPRLVTVLNPPSGRLSHRRFLVQPSFGPEGRLFYPEMVAPTGNDYRTEVRSIRLDGLDRRTHAVIPGSDEAVVSPDGRWLAFEEGDNVYVMPLPWPGIGGRPIEITREERPSLPITSVSTEGGNFPRWTGDATLVFGSANRVFVHDVPAGRTTTHTVTLRVPRDRAAGSVVLRNARVITMDGQSVLETGDVLVTDGRIAAVGRAGSVRVPGGARAFDLRGKTVIPGLVDLHTHNHRGPAGILPQRDYEMAAVLAHGVTTSLDNSMFSQNVFPQAELADTGELIGPRVFSTGDPWNDQYFTQESDLWTDPKLRRFAPWRKLEAHTRRRDLRPKTDYTFPLLAQGLADVIAAGGRGAIGAHGQQHGIASHWEVWMLASAMPPLEALRVATLGGATMIGVQEDIGSIAAGKLADLVVLNGNPLQDIRQTANIAFVMKGGRLFNGDTLDEVWPRQRPYGRFFWEMDEARPGDVKTVR